MNVTKACEALLMYFTYIRGVGYTTALCEGAKNYPNNIIVVRDKREAQRLKKAYNIHAISFKELSSNPYILQGLDRPLLVDSDVVREICQEAVMWQGKVVELERQLNDFKDKFNVHNEWKKHDEARQRQENRY